MQNFQRYLFIFLSLAMGGLFLYSAYTKLYPIQSFEYTMVEFVHMPWLAAAIAARLLIGIEGALGILMCIQFFGKGKWVLKTAFWLLAVFSIYLIYLWATAGNNVNCGCFGDAIWMSPSASLIKNAVMLIITGLLIRYHTGFSGKKFNIAASSIAAVTVILIFIIFALPDTQPNWLRKDRYEIDFSEIGLTNGSSPHALYAPGSTDTSAGSRIDLNHGKYIIAFLSQGCPHCRIAANKMHLLKEKNPDFKFFMIIGGTTSDLTEFWKVTRAENIPYIRLEKTPFMNYTGGVFPLIIWVNNGWVEAKAEYTNMNRDEITKWFAK